MENLLNYTEDDFETINVSPLVYTYDYDNSLYMGDIAKRIESDIRFEKKCRTLAEIRDRRIK